MSYSKIIVITGAVGILGVFYGFSQAASIGYAVDALTEKPIEIVSVISNDTMAQTHIVLTDPKLLDVPKAVDVPKAQKVLTETTQGAGIEFVTQTANVFNVPFYSQFNDISAVEWRKKGCGIASLAMLIEYYKPGEITVDALLDDGISSGAYLNNAGWIHQGLVLLANSHGLLGMARDLSSNTMDTAFAEFGNSVKEGPVIASVHYTFDPQSSIPHLVVINYIKDDRVYYNDPSEDSGGGFISIDTFKRSWKKRYIEIRSTI